MAKKQSKKVKGAVTGKPLYLVIRKGLVDGFGENFDDCIGDTSSYDVRFEDGASLHDALEENEYDSDDLLIEIRIVGLKCIDVSIMDYKPS